MKELSKLKVRKIYESLSVSNVVSYLNKNLNKVGYNVGVVNISGTDVYIISRVDINSDTNITTFTVGNGSKKGNQITNVGDYDYYFNIGSHTDSDKKLINLLKSSSRNPDSSVFKFAKSVINSKLNETESNKYLPKSKSKSMSFDEKISKLTDGQKQIIYDDMKAGATDRELDDAINKFIDSNKRASKRKSTKRKKSDNPYGKDKLL